MYKKIILSFLCICLMLCFVGCEQKVIITTSEIEIENDDETQNTQITSQIIDLSDQEGYIIDGSFCIINDKTYTLKFRDHESKRLNELDVYYSKEGDFKFDSRTGQLLYMRLRDDLKDIAKEDNITKEQAEKIADDFVNRIYKTDGFEKTVHTPDRKVGKDSVESGRYDIYYSSKFLGAEYENISISMLPDGEIIDYSAVLDLNNTIKNLKNIEQINEGSIKTAFFDCFGQQYSNESYKLNASMWYISKNYKPAMSISAYNLEKEQKDHNYVGPSYIYVEFENDGTYSFYEYQYQIHA